jgi:hypothetical protein
LSPSPLPSSPAHQHNPIHPANTSHQHTAPPIVFEHPQTPHTSCSKAKARSWSAESVSRARHDWRNYSWITAVIHKLWAAPGPGDAIQNRRSDGAPIMTNYVRPDKCLPCGVVGWRL